MKLKLDDKINIISLRKLGVPLKEIALKYSVSRSRISQIILYEQEKILQKATERKQWEKYLKEVN